MLAMHECKSLCCKDQLSWAKMPESRPGRATAADNAGISDQLQHGSGALSSQTMDMLMIW